jgi:lactate permease
MVGWSETFEVLPAILVVGCSFAATQYFWSNHVDSNLVDIAAGVVSLAVTIIFLRFWQPKHIWRFEDEREADRLAAAASSAPDPKQHYPGPTHPLSRPGVVDDAIGEEWEKKDMVPAPEPGPVRYTGRQIAIAWMPFAILSVFVLVWGLPSIKIPMNKATTPIWAVPYLHNAVTRAAPVVAKPTPEAAKYDFNWLTATGTGCFFAAIVAGLLLGMGPGRLLKTFFYTLHRMRFAVMAISAMLGLGFITRYSGMDAVLGLAFTRSGWFFPFFGTFLGWLGVALTGSDTSSNALFGSLQRITAQQLGLDPILMCAANSAGGVMGKMVDAQSIVVATAATNQVGNEGVIFRFVVWHSIALAAIVGIIVMTYAYVVPSLVPHGLTFVK